MHELLASLPYHRVGGWVDRAHWACSRLLGGDPWWWVYELQHESCISQVWYLVTVTLLLKKSEEKACRLYKTDSRSSSSWSRWQVSAVLSIL